MHSDCGITLQRLSSDVEDDDEREDVVSEAGTDIIDFEQVLQRNPLKAMLNAKKLSELLSQNVDRLYPRMFVMSPNGTLLAYCTPANIRELRDQAALISKTWKEHEAILKAKLKARNEYDSDQQVAKTDTESSAQESPLETLTIETPTSNLLVRAVQPSLLLILVGIVPPNRKPTFKISAEAEGDPRYPPPDGLSSRTPSLVFEQPVLAAPSRSPTQVTAEEPPFSPRHLEEQDNQPMSPELHVPRKAQAQHHDAELSRSVPSSQMSAREKDLQLGVLHIQRKKLDSLTAYIREDFAKKGFVMPDDSSFP